MKKLQTLDTYTQKSWSGCLGSLMEKHSTQEAQCVQYILLNQEAGVYGMQPNQGDTFSSSWSEQSLQGSILQAVSICGRRLERSVCISVSIHTVNNICNWIRGRLCHPSEPDPGRGLPLHGIENLVFDIVHVFVTLVFFFF